MDSEAPPSSINDGMERSVRVDEEGPTEVVHTARPTDASEMSEDDGLQQPLEVDDLRAAGGSAVLSTSFPLEQQLHTNNGDDDDDDDDAPSPTNFASRPSMRGNNRIEVQVGEEKPQQLNDEVDDDDDDDDVGGAPACLPSGSAAVLSPDYANEPIMLNQSNTSSNDQMIVPSGAFAPPLRADDDDDDDDAQHDGPPMDVGDGGAVMMVASEEWQTWAESDRSSPEPTNFGTRPSVHGKSETDAHDAEKGPQRHNDELDDDDERTEAPSPPNVATTPSMHAQEDANKVEVGEEKPQQLNDEVDVGDDDDVGGAPACLPSGSAAVLSPDYANEPIMLNQSNTSSNDQMIVPSGAFAPPLRADDDDDDDAQHDGPPMDVGDGGVPPMVASEEWQTCAESDASAPAPANFGAQTSMPGKNSTDVDISADSTAPHHDDGVSAAAAADDDTPAMHVVPSSSSQCGGARATPILEEHPSTNLLMSGGSLRSTTTPKQILYAHEGGQDDGDGEVDVPFSSRLHQEATKQMILTEPAIASEESQQLAGDEDDDEAPSPTNFAARSSMHAQEDANKVEVGEEKPQQLNDVVDGDDDDDVGGAPTCLPSGSAAVLSPDYANEPIMLSRSFGPSADDAPKPCRVGDDDHHDDAYPRSQDAAEVESNPEMKREDHDANLPSVGPSNSTTNNTHALMDDDDDDDAPAVVHAVRATTDDVVEHGDDEGRSSIHREDADDGVEVPVVVSASIRVDTQQHADEDDRDHDADDDVHEEVVGVVVDGAQEVPPVEEEQRSESAAANDAAMELIEEVMKDVREEEDDDVEDEVVHPSSQDDVANDLHPANPADDDAPPPHVVASPSPEELSPSPPAMLRPCGTNSHDASAELSAQRCALSTVEVLVEIDGPVSSASAHSHELMGRDVDEGAEASTEEDFLHPCSNESPAGATDDDGDDEPLEENDATQDGSNRYDASASMELIDGRSTQPISSAYKEMRVDDGGRPSTSPDKLDDHDDENSEHHHQQQQQVDDDGAHVPDDEEEQQDDDAEGDDDGTSAHEEEEPQHEDEEGISNGSPAQTSSPPPSRIEGDASPSETEKTAAAAEELADEDKMMMMMEESNNNNNKNNNGATTKRCAPPTHHFYSGRAVDVNPATFSCSSPLDSAMVADYDTILSVRLKSHLTSNALASYYRSTTRSPGVRDANAAAPPLTRTANASPSTHVPTNMMKDIHISTPASQPDDDNDTSLLVRRAMESLSDRGRAMPALMGDVPLSKRCFQRDDEVGRRVRAMRAMTREGEANAELTTLGGMLLATTHRLRQMGRYDGCRAIYPNKVNDVPQKITPAYCRAHPLTDDVANE